MRGPPLAGKLAVAGIAAILVAPGCVEREPGSRGARSIKPAAIVVQPAMVQLEAGGTAQLVVQINDGAGQPIGGAPIAFRTADATVAEVSALGQVRSVGPAGTTKVVVASGATEATVPVTVRPGPPARLGVVAADALAGAAGAPLPAPVAAEVTDAFGNASAGVTLTFAVDAGSVSPATAVTGPDGRAATSWTLGPSVGRQQLRVAGPGSLATNAVASSGPGAPARLVAELTDVTVVAGTELNARVRIEDAFGNLRPETPVQWGFARGDAPAATISTSDAAGVASARLAAPTRSGPATLVASLAGSETAVPPARIAVTVTAGPAARLALTAGGDQRARAGRVLPVAPAVQVTDTHGNPVAGVSVSCAPGDGAGTVERPDPVTDEGGSADCGRWTLGDEAGIRQLRISAAGIAEPLVVTATATGSRRR